jgi:hypothetical protein
MHASHSILHWGFRIQDEEISHSRLRWVSHSRLHWGFETQDEEVTQIRQWEKIPTLIHSKEPPWYRKTSSQRTMVGMHVNATHTHNKRVGTCALGNVGSLWNCPRRPWQITLRMRRTWCTCTSMPCRASFCRTTSFFRWSLQWAG